MLWKLSTERAKRSNKASVPSCLFGVVGRNKASSRRLNIALSLLVLVGGMILRYAWIVAGRASADDPEAVHS
jgi:hypothetical protein